MMKYLMSACVCILVIAFCMLAVTYLISIVWWKVKIMKIIKDLTTTAILLLFIVTGGYLISCSSDPVNFENHIQNPQPIDPTLGDKWYGIFPFISVPSVVDVAVSR